MRRAWAVWKRDLEDALRNSTFLLVLIGPVLISILLTRVSSKDDFARPHLGIVGPRQEGLGLVLSTSDGVLVQGFRDTQEARQALQDGQIDGFLELDSELTEGLVSGDLPVLGLSVQDAGSVKTALMVSAIEEAARTVADQEMPLDLQVNGEEGSASHDLARTLLSNWVVFTAMSGLMICSASIIEEKEQRTLPGVLTAPVSMVELWVGKVGSGFTLALLSTLAVLLGNSIIPSSLLLLHLITGCLCFAAMGILVGLVCSNQSAANAATSTLFMMIYIPLALQELSSVLSRAAAISPAYYLQRGAGRFLAGQVESGMTDLMVLALFLAGLAAAGLWSARKPHRILSTS